MEYFTAIPEAQAVIHSKGVYRQVPLYQRATRIYAKSGAGYVRLMQGGATSAANIRWADIDCPEGAWTEDRGYVTYTPPICEAAE